MVLKINKLKYNFETCRSVKCMKRKKSILKLKCGKEKKIKYFVQKSFSLREAFSGSYKDTSTFSAPRKI